VQNCKINPDFDLFLQRKNGGLSPRAVDRARVAGPRWTRDRDRVAPSLERGLLALQSLGAHRGLGKKERSSGGPHRGLRWLIQRRGKAGGDEGRTAAMKLGVGRLGVQRMGNGGGDECGEEGRAPRPFIGSEGGAARLNGEGDRAAGGGGINVGHPVLWGGETEG
jgi:hypothetical protein